MTQPRTFTFDPDLNEHGGYTWPAPCTRCGADATHCVILAPAGMDSIDPRDWRGLDAVGFVDCKTCGTFGDSTVEDAFEASEMIEGWAA